MIEVSLFRNYLPGIALKDLGKIEEAIKDYSKSIEIDPEYEDAYY